MKKCLWISFAFFFVFSSYSIVSIRGDSATGFSFSLFPKMIIDELKQVVYFFAGELMVQSSGQYAISGFDTKNNFAGGKMRAIPLVNQGAFINGIVESNPLYGNYFSCVSQCIGTNYEPKVYPIVVPADSSQIYIVSDIELYFQNKNKLFVSNELVDVNGDPGQIYQVAPGLNSFLALVIEKNTIFGGSNSICTLYDYGIKETIIPVPGSTNYLTSVAYSTPVVSTLSNTSPFFCFTEDAEVDLKENYLTCHGLFALNRKYIGVSGLGVHGIKAVTLFNQPILPSSCESAVSGNNIVVCNLPNTPLFIRGLASLNTSIGLQYLLVQGGLNDEEAAKSFIYSLPIINYNNDVDSSGALGVLANVNQKPLSLSDSGPIKKHLGMVFTGLPSCPGDLYDTASVEALVGKGPIYAVGKNDLTLTPVFKQTINDCFSYRDSVFITAQSDLPYVAGGIFYSQGLFNEYGVIKNWTRWQRKNISVNLNSAQYVPTLGTFFAVPKTNPMLPVTTQCGDVGIFLSSKDSAYQALPCASSGIQKIIDIPWSHPGIGVDGVLNTGYTLSPSYFLSVGYNTVILQQTAQYNDFYPFSTAQEVISCTNGWVAELAEKTPNTKTVTFSGGSLENAGALFTGCLAYTDLDSWLVVGGEGGLFVLRKNDGSGMGADFLRGNFEGIDSEMKWVPLADCGIVKKVIANRNFLYVITADKVYRIDTTAQNFSQAKNASMQTLISIRDLPGATEYSSFSDGLCSNTVCIVATSLGLFTNVPGSNIKIGSAIPVQKIDLPEDFSVVSSFLYPVTQDGVADSWGYGPSNQITANIYLLATSIATHNTKLYRFAVYGNDGGADNTIRLIPNFFIEGIPSYFYNPNIELLSVATDGASILSHGVYGNSLLYRSYIGLINPFAKHGAISLKSEYNFFELYSKSNMYCGFPTYISGNGSWMFSSRAGFQGMF